MKNKLFFYLLNITTLIWILSIPQKNSLYQISTFLLGVLLFTDIYLSSSYLKAKELFFKYKHLFITFGFIILSMAISNTLGVEAKKQWYLLLMYILRYGLVFFALLYFYEKKYLNLKRLLYFILFSISLQAIDGLYQHIFGIDFIKGHKVQNGAWLTGGMFYYNPFGMLMAIGAGISLTLLSEFKNLHLKRVEIVSLILLTLLCIYDLMYSLSRASWVAFAAFLFFMTVIKYKSLNLKNLSFLLILVVVTITIILNDQSIMHRFHQLLQGDSSNRFDIWKASIEAFLQAPFFGYGLNSFKIIVTANHNGAHNNILEILLYLGIFGFIFFSYMLYLVAKEIFNSKNLFYLPLFMLFLTISQFDNSITSSKIFLSILTIFAFFIFTTKNKNLTSSTSLPKE